MTQLEIGTLVRITRPWPGQANGWGVVMDRYVGRVFTVRANSSRVDARAVAADGDFYYTLTHADGVVQGETNPYLWSIRSLDIRRPLAEPGQWEWVPADPRDNPVGQQPAAAPAPAPTPPATAHKLYLADGDPNMRTKFVSLRVGPPGREQAVLSAQVSNYAMGCCGVGQLHSFSGSVATNSPSGLTATKQLTATMAADWLAAVMMNTAYSSYIPMQAVFCITEAQKAVATIRFLTEFLGAKPLWNGKNRAHSPHSMLNMYMVDLDCPDLIHVSNGTKGQSSVCFAANKGAQLDPKGRFKEWIDGLK